MNIVNGEPFHAEEMYAIESEVFSMPWSADSIRDEILQNAICKVAIDEKGKIHGHVYMRHITNEGHITNIAVRKESQKKGIASLLMQALVQAAKSLGIVALTLEVRESNFAAINLYKKFGFSVEGVRKNFYSTPSENGIIMWKYNKKTEVRT